MPLKGNPIKMKGCQVDLITDVHLLKSEILFGLVDPTLRIISSETWEVKLQVRFFVVGVDDQVYSINDPIIW
ncbi:hypothetical protein Hanom_Chr04g00371741 [Helianthus anomalus]